MLQSTDVVFSAPATKTFVYAGDDELVSVGCCLPDCAVIFILGCAFHGLSEARARSAPSLGRVKSGSGKGAPGGEVLYK